jgi:hypothetical protein
MSRNKFVGIAYWTVATSVALWLAKAAEALAPLEKAGLAVLSYDCLPGGDQLTVQFGDERHQMLVADGKGRGVVRASESAAMFVVCLVALRKVLGDITVVTDSQETVPTLPRQNYPVYTDSWLRVLPVAQELGLATGAAFTARHTSLLNNMF